MTDSEKLDQILQHMNFLTEQVSALDDKVKELKRQSMKNTAELKAMDSMILDEVERVHEILDKHAKNISIHTA